MGIILGETFPDFKADSTRGEISLHDWIGDSWCILFSHPADFTPVCTTEFKCAALLTEEFAKRNVKMIGLSCDAVETHHGWSKDVISFAELAEGLPFPIIADESRDLAIKLGMLEPEHKTAAGLPMAARALFIIGPDKKLKLSILYPATTGRDFDEILRVVESLQLTAKYNVATPADWKPGNKVMVQPFVKKEDEATLFPAGVETKAMPSGKNYMRYTPHPGK